MHRYGKGMSALLSTAVLIIICVSGGLLLYTILSGRLQWADEGLSIESADLVKQTDGCVTFAIIIKNVGGKTVKTLILTLDGEEQVSTNIVLEPRKSTSLVLSSSQLTKDYVVGNVYTVTVEAIFVDGSARSITTSLRCRGCGSSIRRETEEEGGGEAEGEQIDFAISLSPSGTKLLPGESNFTVLRISLLNGTSADVTLSTSGLPPGVSVEFSQNPLTVSQGSPASCIMNVATDATAPVGNYAVEVIGTVGTLRRKVIYTLIIIEEGGLLLSLKDQDFCFGFTNGLSDQWFDEKQAKTYMFQFSYYLEYEAMGSPSGPSQQNNAIIYVWGADFIFGWGDEVYVYRYSTSEAMNPESSSNIYANLLPPPEI